MLVNVHLNIKYILYVNLMTKIIIFDLDDTLVNAHMIIPKQTYHMLNKFKYLNYIIGIISYNCLVNIVAKETHLCKYTTHIFYGNLDRNILFEKCLNSIYSANMDSLYYPMYYADDRADNIHVVKTYFDKVITYHCVDMYQLYKFKHIISREEY